MREEVRSDHRQATYETATPVVADEMDRLGTRLELGDQPGQVVLLGRGESGGTGAAEAWEVEAHHVIAPPRLDQGGPDRRGLRVAVDEDDGHGRSLGLVTSASLP